MDNAETERLAELVARYFHEAPGVDHSNQVVGPPSLALRGGLREGASAAVALGIDAAAWVAKHGGDARDACESWARRNATDDVRARAVHLRKLNSLVETVNEGRRARVELVKLAETDMAAEKRVRAIIASEARRGAT